MGVFRDIQKFLALPNDSPQRQQLIDKIMPCLVALSKTHGIFFKEHFGNMSTFFGHYYFAFYLRRFGVSGESVTQEEKDARIALCNFLDNRFECRLKRRCLPTLSELVAAEPQVD